MMMYYIWKHNCIIPFIHMEQFLSHSKLNNFVSYIHYFYCLM